MGLKGTATIELTNADGSKEVIKHENMITNASRDLLVSNRGEMAPLFKMHNKGYSYAKALFGGILLFNDTLNTNADDYHIPSLKVTGYASQDAYAGLDVARGSFSESETGLQADGSYKFVWDFSTSQANGTIKSIALCPNIMGQIGLSKSIVSSELKDFSTINGLTAPFGNGRFLDDSETVDGITSYYLFLVAKVGDIGYALDFANICADGSYPGRQVVKNGGILKLYRFRLGVDSIGISNNIGKATYIDTVNVQLPSEFVSNLHVSTSSYDQYAFLWTYWNNDDKKLIIFPCYLKNGNLAVNSTIQYLELDIATMNLSTFTFTNNTAGEIPQSSTARIDGGGALNILVYKDYILATALVDGKKKFYSIKRSDNTQVKEIKFQDGSEFSIPTNHFFNPVFTEGKIVIVRYLADFSIPTNARYVAIDLENGIVQGTNANRISTDNSIDFGNKVLALTTGSYLYCNFTLNPFLLTTKNNLDSPVVKTSSQTMKITYTLTESEG